MSGEGLRRGFREALRAYVTGHDRVASTESEVDRGADVKSEFAADLEWTNPSDEPARYGVGIPDRLEFHRGPATWREDRAGAARRSGENDAP